MCVLVCVFFFFKQKTAYEMRISDWSSDVCSSDLLGAAKVPDVLVFEKRAIGSAWSGDGGYSSGHLTLCSPAEKDVGFPYSELRARHSQEPPAPPLPSRFSWSSFLVSTGAFAA